MNDELRTEHRFEFVILFPSPEQQFVAAETGGGQAKRLISIGRLNPLLDLHPQPIAR